MEPNAQPDGIGSSVSSLVSTFVQLNLNVITSSGPINRLPNELIKHIFAQLKLKPARAYASDYKYYYDVKQLVRLRLVSTRWRAIVEDFCLEKKCLCVNSGHVSKLDLKNSAPLIVNTKSADFFGMMPKLFPNIVQLDIGSLRNLKDSELPNFALNISQLSSLKQLEIVGIERALPFLSQTLSQLEHIFVISGSNYNLTEEEMLKFVCQLGPDCVRVFLVEGIDFDYQQIRQWHSRMPNFFANVTHQEIGILEQNDDYQLVVHFLSVHAPSLKLLYFTARAHPLELTPTLLDDLDRLTNLVELQLWNIRMSFPELEEAAAQHLLTQLSSVLVCELGYVCLTWDRFVGVDQLTRILSIIFPNLVDLDLQLELEMETVSSKLPEEQEFVQYFDRFPHLRKRIIRIFKSGWTIDGQRIPLDGFPFNIHV